MTTILEGISALCLIEGALFFIWAYCDSLPDLEQLGE